MDPRERFADCTDNELMRCTAAGQKTAYEVLILRHRKAAEGYCLSLIRDEREAEDIVQDSFADIYVQREAYRDTFSFQAYLYAVIRHKASDHLRRAGRSETLDETVLEAVPGREPSPEEEFFRREETDRLAEWIMDLPGEKEAAEKEDGRAMKKQDEEFIRDVFRKAEEKEQSSRLARVLKEEQQEPDLFLLLRTFCREAGMRGPYMEMGDVICLAFAVTVLCFWGIYAALGQDPEQLLSAVFVSAPVLYGMVFALCWLKEVQNGTYSIQMSYRFTFFHILAVRMFGTSLLGLAVNGIYAVFLTFRCEVDGIRIFAVSFTSLMLFSLILLAGIRKGRSIGRGIAAGAGWMILQITASVLMNVWYQKLLSAVPLLVLFAAGVLILGIYIRELGSLSGIQFRKEFTDAEN